MAFPPHIVFPLPLSWRGQSLVSPPHLIDINHIKLGCFSDDLFNLHYFLKGPISKYIHLEARTSTYEC